MCLDTPPDLGVTLCLGKKMKDQEAKQLNPFEKLYNRELTPDELAEIKHNFFGFMDLLVQIDKEHKQTKEGAKND